MSSALQQLLDQRQLWRGRDAGESAAALPTGWPRLDRELYGAGWPQACLTELLCSEPVLVWQLLQPALVQLSRQQRLLIWIGYEQPPYAPAWYKAGLQLARCLLVRAGEDEAPWAAEQALRLAQGGAVILQSNVLTPDRLRRLQLAAQAGHSHAFLLRPLSAQRQTTPATLRLQLQPAVAAFQLQILKRRGGTTSEPFSVPVSIAAPVLPAQIVLAMSRTEATASVLPTMPLLPDVVQASHQAPDQREVQTVPQYAQGAMQALHQGVQHGLPQILQQELTQKLSQELSQVPTLASEQIPSQALQQVSMRMSKQSSKQRLKQALKQESPRVPEQLSGAVRVSAPIAAPSPQRSLKFVSDQPPSLRSVHGHSGS